MSELWSSVIAIMIGGILTSNIIFYHGWGNCPFLGVSRKTDSAVGMGLAVTFVLTVASAAIFVVYNYILLPLGIDYLGTIIYILVIASLVQLIEIFLKRLSPTLYNSLGIYLALITTNCAILFVANVNVAFNYSFLESVANGFATGIGFTLALIIMAGIRERTAKSDVPKAMRGFPIALIAAAILSLAFMGFNGFSFV